jgi:hypothetical protein
MASRSSSGFQNISIFLDEHDSVRHFPLSSRYASAGAHEHFGLTHEVNLLQTFTSGQDSAFRTDAN